MTEDLDSELSPLDFLNETDRSFLNTFVDKRLIPLVEEQEPGKFSFQQLADTFEEYKKINPDYVGPVNLEHVAYEIFDRVTYDTNTPYLEYEGTRLSSSGRSYDILVGLSFDILEKLSDKE